MPRRLTTAALALATAAALSACVAAPVPVSVARSQPPAPAHAAPAARPLPADAFGTALNAMRARAGLPPLTRSARLDRIAGGHATDIAPGVLATKRIRDHRGTDGSTPKQRLQRAGYNVCRGGENIAFGQGSATRALDWWASSPPHRANLLMRGVTEYGLARADGNVWVMMVGRAGC